MYTLEGNNTCLLCILCMLMTRMIPLLTLTLVCMSYEESTPGHVATTRYSNKNHCFVWFQQFSKAKWSSRSKVDEHVQECQVAPQPRRCLSVTNLCKPSKPHKKCVEDYDHFTIECLFFFPTCAHQMLGPPTPLLFYTILVKQRVCLHLVNGYLYFSRKATKQLVHTFVCPTTIIKVDNPYSVIFLIMTRFKIR